MTISELLTKTLCGKTTKADVDFYDSMVCLTRHAKNQIVIIQSVEVFDDGDYTMRGIISGGENDGKECNFNFSLEQEFIFI